jgi:succinate dehydrogenase / fumarate reductase flavoprotein subunit
MMGGIHTNIDGATELQGVWAAGEAACNSVHGSNRLGANSTSECIVYCMGENYWQSCCRLH